MVITLREKGGKAGHREIALALHLSPATLKNLIGMIQALGLIVNKDDTLQLTDDGRQLAEFLLKKDTKSISALFERIKGRSPVLLMANEILRNNPNISDTEIGRSICTSLGKRMNDGYYDRLGERSRLYINFFQTDSEKYSSRGSGEKEARPNLTFQKMMKMIQEADSNGLIDKKNVGISGRMMNCYNTLIGFGLISESKRKEYQLTDLGRSLRNKPDERKRIFVNILLKNDFTRGIIEHLKSRKPKEITKDTMGRIIRELNPKIWGVATTNEWGKNVINWLKNAGLIEKIGDGIYQIADDLMELELPHTNILEPVKTTPQLLEDFLPPSDAQLLQAQKKEGVVSNLISIPIKNETGIRYSDGLSEINELILELTHHISAHCNDLTETENMKEIEGLVESLRKNTLGMTEPYLVSHLRIIEKRILGALKSNDSKDWNNVMDHLWELHKPVKKMKG